MKVETGTEAVERLASRVNTVADGRCYGIAATLRALAAERDALQDEWDEIAAGITTEIPEVGALWPMVSEVSGSLAACRNLFRNEVASHSVTKAERDAAHARAERLEGALRAIDGHGWGQHSATAAADFMQETARAALAGGPGR